MDGWFNKFSPILIALDDSTDSRIMIEVFSKRVSQKQTKLRRTKIVFCKRNI